MADINSLIEEERSLTEEIKELSKTLNSVKDSIRACVAEQLDAGRKEKDTGTVSAYLDHWKISETIPKIVKWDQAILANITKQIEKAGDDATKYIDIKYSVNEHKFKKFPEPVQVVFTPARTVTQGKAQLEISERCEG